MNEKLTIKDIEEWIDNDEGLYKWHRGSRKSKREFIKENREALECCIRLVLDGTKPAHFLAYPGFR